MKSKVTLEIEDEKWLDNTIMSIDKAIKGITLTSQDTLLLIDLKHVLIYIQKEVEKDKLQMKGT